MTKQQLNEIRERCEAATPAPWCVMNSAMHNAKCIWSETKRKYSNQYDVATVIPYENNVKDVEFMAHARKDVPDLLDYIAKLESRLENTCDGCYFVKTDSHKFYTYPCSECRRRCKAHYQKEGEIQDA